MIRGMEWIAPESVFDIGNEKFLMLLLMVQAQNRQFLCFTGNCARLKKLKHVFINMGTVSADFVQTRTGKCIAQSFLRLLSHGVVIRVKKVAELRMEGTISR